MIEASAPEVQAMVENSIQVAENLQAKKQDDVQAGTLFFLVCRVVTVSLTVHSKVGYAAAQPDKSA